MTSPSRNRLQSGFELGQYRVEPDRNRITGPDGEARVEPRVMAVLMQLALHAGETRSRRQLEHDVWHGAVVSEQTLTNCISELRGILGDDASRPRFIETVPKTGYRLVSPVEPLGRSAEIDAAGNESISARRHGAVQWLTLIVAVLGIGALAFFVWSPTPNPGDAALTSISVRPFDNARKAPGLDYLKLALPDEITTVLSRAEDLAVRPFDPGEKFAEGARGSREVDRLVTGHFYTGEDNRLRVAVEVRDTARDHLVWRSQVAAPLDDALALRESIAQEIREGLLPVLGAKPDDVVPQPSDPEAYRLYLRSLAVGRDAEPNRRGIEMLEEVVNHDPDFTSAWAALARRHHHDYLYAGGGDRALRRSKAAAERALRLSPDSVIPATQLIMLQTEAGQRLEALVRATELVESHRRNPYAHFALSFAQRYSGLHARAQRHCRMALTLDPHNYQWRSCALAYLADGRLEPAREFIELDTGADWADLVLAHRAIRQGNRKRALDHARSLPADNADRRFLEACLQGAEPASLSAQADAMTERWLELEDPEPAYYAASMLAFCGRTEDALAMLAHAARGGFCLEPALSRDPIWNPSEFDGALAKLRAQGAECRNRSQERARSLR